MSLLLISAVTVVGSLAGAADPPAVAPLPRLLRDNAPPEAWKLSDLSASLPEPDRLGVLVVLAWEQIDFGGVMEPLERCLVVKRYLGLTGTHRHVLGYLIRRPGAGQRAWAVETIYLTGQQPGDPTAIRGIREYPHRPTDQEIATFLKDLSWEHFIRPGEVKLGGRDSGPRRVEHFVPKLTNGGICRTACKQVLGRDAPLELFPEFKRSSDPK